MSPVIPSRRAPLAILAAVGAVAACNLSPEPLPDLSRCREIGEIGNTGCARLRGIVTDPDGRPYPGVQLHLRPPTGRGSYQTATATSDAVGVFGVQLTRLSVPAQTTNPDTLTTYLVYVVPDTANLREAFTDSTRVTLQLFPPGERPTIATMTLRLPRR